MAKKKKKTAAERQQSASPQKFSGSDSDWDKDESSPVRKKKRTKKVTFPRKTLPNTLSTPIFQFSRSSSESDSDDEPPVASKPTPDDDKSDKSELEEGQVATDDDSDSDDSWDSEFNDGYDENLMGDESDRARLEGLSEKERETEIFKRIERRDEMKTRWEIERKLRQIKRGGKEKVLTPKEQKLKEEQRKKKKEKARLEAAAAAAAMEKPIVKEVVPAASKTTTTERKNDDAEENWDSEPEYFDPKERSKERKKNVEMNKTDDKRSNAMAALKAKREGKQKRGKSNNCQISDGEIKIFKKICRRGRGKATG